MKKVVETSEVAHLWANQSQSEARNSGGNFYFNDKIIYSYGGHFPIAVLHSNNGAKTKVLFTTRSYSKTTAKHIGITRSASNQYEKIYCYNPFSASCGNHTENIGKFEAASKSMSHKLAKAKKPEIYLSQIAEQREMLTNYCDYFGLNIPSLNLVYVWIESKDTANKASEAELKAVEERKRLREIENKKRLTNELRKFRAFKMNRIYISGNNSYLRYNATKNRIETSQAVEIPLRTAKTFYNQILKTIKTGKCDICDTKFMDSYDIKAINKDFIEVGCHVITIKEIKLIATKLNW